MKNTKFLVKVNRGGARTAEYVLRIDRSAHPDHNQQEAGFGHGKVYGRRCCQIDVELAMHPRVDIGIRLKRSLSSI